MSVAISRHSSHESSSRLARFARSPPVEGSRVLIHVHAHPSLLDFVVLVAVPLHCRRQFGHGLNVKVPHLDFNTLPQLPATVHNDACPRLRLLAPRLGAEHPDRPVAALAGHVPPQGVELDALDVVGVAPGSGNLVRLLENAEFFYCCGGGFC